MKIHSALEAGGRVVKKETVTSWDRFQAQSIWGIPACSSGIVRAIPGMAAGGRGMQVPSPQVSSIRVEPTVKLTIKSPHLSPH